MFNYKNIIPFVSKSIKKMSFRAWGSENNGRVTEEERGLAAQADKKCGTAASAVLGRR